MKTYIGLNYAEFKQVLDVAMPSLLPVFKNESKARDALYIYLMKLRTSHTLEQISPHFNLTVATIGGWIKKLRNILHATFVPLYLYNRDRQEILQNTTPLSRKLYKIGDESAVITFDATYVFTIKSSNYGFQKQSYSVQFGRNLVKFMTCVTTNGLIVAAYGPFDARKNDATITTEIMCQQGTVFDILLPGDVIVVDRGFRDCIPNIIRRGFLVKVPKGTQSNTLIRPDANDSRFATKARFVVEVRNTHIKNIWKHLSGTKEYQFIPHLKKDFQLSAALVNAFSKKIISDKNDWMKTGNLMLNKYHQLNPLQAIVNRIPKTAYTRVENLTLFPKMTYAELKDVSNGTYQIRQARSYCQSHLKANNNVFVSYICNATICNNLFKKLLTSTTNPILIYINLMSRFQSRKSHDVYVLLSKAKIKGNKEKYIISNFCCSCRHGLRTVGCCSHVMLLIWFTLFINPAKVQTILPSKNFDTVFDKWDDEYSFTSDSDSDSDLSNTSIDSLDSE